MFYLTTLSTHFISYIGTKHMVKDHLESEIGNTLPQLHGLLFLTARDILFALSTYRIIHTMSFGIPPVGHWVELEKSPVKCPRRRFFSQYSTN